MWVDESGVLHTVALPEPSDVMDAEFLAGIDGLDEPSRAQLESLLAQAEDRLYDADFSGMSQSPEYVAMPPPRDLMRGEMSGPLEVLAAVEQVDLRWRLDVIMALQDHLE